MEGNDRERTWDWDETLLYEGATKERRSYGYAVYEEEYMKSYAVGFGIVHGVFLLGLVQGCNQSANLPVQAPEKTEIDEASLEYERQLTQAAEQLKLGDEQGRRYDALLDKWEEQARRMDAVLTRWEHVLDGLEKEGGAD